MRMRGVPKEHTDWILYQLDSCKTKLILDNYYFEPFTIENGLNQGNPHSLICYLFYNAGLAEIPVGKSGGSGVLFVDDNSILAIGKDFHTTHSKLHNMINREDGINWWAEDHNCNFGIVKYQLYDLSC
jgi:hypothetical protein